MSAKYERREECPLPLIPCINEFGDYDTLTLDTVVSSEERKMTWSIRNSVNSEVNPREISHDELGIISYAVFRASMKRIY